jgi:ketosteroid isomerase-like protein
LLEISGSEFDVKVKVRSAFMKKASLVLALTILAAAPAVADDKSDVMAVVSGFTDAFNKGDEKAAVATCADQTSIIDEFPPYEWHGEGACAKWAADYDADAKKKGITGGAVTLGKARHLDVTGDRAYVVVPADYAMTQKGKAVKQKDATLIGVLQKGAAGWRIVAWSWAQGKI